MKKILLIALIFTVSIFISNACDFCNCYLGLNPHFKKNSIGLRYHYTSYTGSHMDENKIREMNMSEDDFWERRTNIELHSQWYPTQKIKVLLSIPYIINSEGINGTPSMENGYFNQHIETAETGTETTEGTGDPLLVVHHQLFNKNNDTAGFSHRLLAGGGIKFPLGKWELEEGAESHERVHQPGTGSWDFLAVAEYLAKYNRFGLNVNVSFLFTTPNNQLFRFANRVNVNAIGYYQINVKETSFYPCLGIFYEQAGQDIDHHITLKNSGGTILYAHAGLDFYFKHLSLNTALQLPAIQKLNDPQPNMNLRLIAGITYSFN
jgi:hypothetical protein